MRRLTLRRRLEALEAARAASRPPACELTPEEQLGYEVERAMRFLRLKAEERGCHDYEPDEAWVRARLLELRRRRSDASTQ